jgi:hypothetical protein
MFWTAPTHERLGESYGWRSGLVRAAGLARSFLLLEDDSLAGEPPVQTQHPHRSPPRNTFRRRRPGAGVPPPQPCLSPLTRRARVPRRRSRPSGCGSARRRPYESG